MLDAPQILAPAPPTRRLRSLISLLSLVLALVLLTGTYFLMSPPAGQSYPGAIPWRDGSILKHVTDLMSLYGLVETIRGVEIKDFAFHLAAVVALVLLAARALVSGLLPPERRTAKGAWFLGQAFLAGWVLLSLASSRWSGDPDLSLGQAALYGLPLAWAVALAWSFESRDVPRLLWGYLVIAAAGAALCVWYFYERNPYHRPGFPIGNPGVLAACTLPAILIAGAVLIGSLWTSLGRRHTPAWSRLAAPILMLIPLCWCFRLADSRAAWIGLCAGIAGVLYLRAKRWIRLVILVGVILAAGMGAWYFSSARHDFPMARGATIRFRVYAWRYAALLWSQRPISGAGAANYSRLAGRLSVGDRVLDPAAFPAEMVEHAHNELFEVFAEIGLVGGVTFVAGFLATLVAASALLRANLSPERRWLLYGLVASIIALLADAMFGVGLRLPGVPAVFYTLLGTLWAVCRSISKVPPTQRALTDTWLRSMLLRRYGLTLVSLAAALVAAWLSLRNWAGVRHEYAADLAQRAGQYEAALGRTRAAETRLLDPVRTLIAHKRAVDCEFARAVIAYQQVVDAFSRYQATRAEDGNAVSADSELREQLQHAERLCRTASDAALQLSRRAPNFGRMAALGAQSAEMLASLRNMVGDREQAQAARLSALQDWRRQREWRPFDVQALLALARYPTLLGDYIGLLRDALRAEVPPGGFPPPEWHEALQAGGKSPNFQRTLTAMVRAVGPYHPQTDLDTLILSRAPEMYRLSAAWKALQRAHQSAATDAAHAAQLYRPMRSRFPKLYSVALAEQADYVFQAQPDQPDRAVALLREAIRALPVIQAQKYEEMVAPYRLRLARFLLAAGEVTQASELLQMVLRTRPGDVEAWWWTVAIAIEHEDAEAVRAALRDAEAAGVRDTDLEVLRGLVRQKMPEIFGTPQER